MAQIKLNIPDEVHKVLKERAEADDRSLSNYINRLLKKIANEPEVPATPAPGLYYPPGVRSPENPEGRPVVTNEYNSYYKTAPRKTIID